MHRGDSSNEVFMVEYSAGGDLEDCLRESFSSVEGAALAYMRPVRCG